MSEASVHNIEEIIADFEQWAIHHAGMVRLLDMRGGIHSITSCQLRDIISWYAIPNMRNKFEATDCYLGWKSEAASHKISDRTFSCR
jgi:hypothetical protein